MDAVINVMKPAGMTSMSVISRVRGITATKKAGHTGTLDPDVTGVLPVFVGQYTKAIRYLENDDKAYRATCVLGAITETQDAGGEIVEAQGCEVELEVVREALLGFVGEYEQLPPMYSAKWVNGQRLYNLARQGVEIERKCKKVKINSIEILDLKTSEMEVDGKKINTVEIEFVVECSRGTYIRTLCHDLGQKLGCGGYMSKLIRTRSGSFSIDNALTFDELQERKENGTLNEIVVPLEDVFDGYPRVKIGDRELVHFLNGVRMNRLSRGLVAQLRQGEESAANSKAKCLFEGGYFAFVTDENDVPQAIAKVYVGERFEIRLDRKLVE